MRKNLTKSRLVMYLVMLAAAGLLVTGVTYSKYYSRIDGEGKAQIALWKSESNPITIDVSGLQPGKSQTYEFAITNTKDGQTSQVTQKYSVTVETTENLPFTYSLRPDSSKTDVSGTLIPQGELPIMDGKGTASGEGILPHTTEASHTYILTVNWPAGKADMKYADEIEMVTLTVNAYQEAPDGE